MEPDNMSDEEWCDALAYLEKIRRMERGEKG
jgi:hypothetical protein